MVSSFSCAQRVHIGAGKFIESHLNLVDGKRVGVICNHTSIFPDGVHLVDSLLKIGVHVTALFGPEHGIRGNAGAGEQITDGKDTKSGIKIYSLYGKTQKPTEEMLKDVDVLIFDIQDIGARFYTYASTMALAMDAAGEYHKQFIVLDRPNPINGIDIEGPVLDTSFKSFVGMFPIPIRHGLTIGELAKMIAGEGWIEHPPELTVIAMEGWKRSQWFDGTGLPWIAPSPNMKTMETATVYPGLCLFEGTNITEARGTNHPFEYIGAPWIDGNALAVKLNSMHIPGVTFDAIQFTPMPDSIAAPHPKYEEQLCKGVYVKVTDRKILRPVETALTMLREIIKLYPDSMKFLDKTFDRLAGQSGVRCGLLYGERCSDAIIELLPAFSEIRRKYLMY